MDLKRLLKYIILTLSYLFASGLVLFYALEHPGIDGYPKAMFPDVIEGKAHKPFTYRILLPVSIKTISSITPSFIKQSIVNSLSQREIIKHLKWKQDYLFEYSAAVLLMWASLFFFQLVLRATIKSVYNFPPWLSDFLPILAVIFLPAFFKYYTYLYDFPILFLFTLSLLLLIREKPIPFLLVFILATLNKETSILLAILFVMRFKGSFSKRALVYYFIGISLIWLIVTAVLRVHYQNNPGSMLEFHLLDHNLGLVGSVDAIVYLVLFFGFWTMILAHNWKNKPSFLKQGLIVTALPLLLLGMLFGNFDELRMYYEAYPFAFLLLTHTLSSLYGVIR